MKGESAVLFAPHNDDETLFAFMQCLRHKPKVVIVFRSHREELQGGPTAATREHETDLAMSIARCDWEQWAFNDSRPEPALNEADFITWSIKDECRKHDLVIAPAFELGGHEQHNYVAKAVEWSGHTNVLWYLTYKRGHGRSDHGTEVVPSADERLLKDVALACYQSQAEWPPTKPWFDPADQREFLA